MSGSEAERLRGLLGEAIAALRAGERNCGWYCDKRYISDADTRKALRLDATKLAVVAARLEAQLATASPPPKGEVK